MGKKERTTGLVDEGQFLFKFRGDALEKDALIDTKSSSDILRQQ